LSFACKIFRKKFQMKILITGSAGFLGKSLVSQIDKKNNNLYFILRKKKNGKNNFCCPLENIKKVKYITNLLKPDVIINIAAEVNFQKKTKNMFRVNALVPKIFSQYCKKNEKYFIHVSGTLVNGIHSLYNHQTKFKPISHYGKSKLKAETFIREINCKYAILRFGGIYGKNGPSHLGINKFITDAFANKKIHFYGNPQTLRNYIFVNDAARAIVNCMKHKVIGAFYVGGQIQTFEKMLNKIVKIINKNKKVNFIDNNQPRSDQLIENDEIIKPISFKKSLEIMRLE
jgi:nucleoside-diphosphate-sugar epimerase